MWKGSLYVIINLLIYDDDGDDVDDDDGDGPRMLPLWVPMPRAVFM